MEFVLQNCIDFMRACPKNSGLASSVRAVRSHFMNHVLLIENDKLTPLATSKVIRCEMWNKSSFVHLTYLRQAGVCVLNSSDKGDTARLVAMLSQLESKEMQGIKMLPKNVPEIKVWKDTIMKLPYGPRRVAVAGFRLTIGHDCLAKHLHRISLSTEPTCSLCDLQVNMDRDHLRPSIPEVHL